MTAALFDAGLRPDYVAGLSLGEYSALEASGVLTAKSAIGAGGVPRRGDGESQRGHTERDDRRAGA